MLKVFTVGCVNAINAVVYHSGCKKTVKDRLGLGVMFFYKAAYGINSSGQRGNYTDIAFFVKLQKFFRLYRRQRMLNPSFVGNNRIKFNEILDGNNSLYLMFYGFFNNRFTGVIEFGILIVGIDKDIGINQTCGQDTHRKAFPCQMPVFLYVRDERPVSLKGEFSFLFLAMSCFSFSDILQSLLSRQSSLQADFPKYLLFFSVFQLASALFKSSLYSIANLFEIYHTRGFLSNFGTHRPLAFKTKIQGGLS